MAGRSSALKFIGGARRGYGIRNGQLLVSESDPNNGNPSLWLVDLEHRTRTEIMVGAIPEQAEWDPSGSRIAVLTRSSADFGVVVCDLATRQTLSLRDSGVKPWLLRWSADGGAVFFVERRPQEGRIEPRVVRRPLLGTDETSYALDPSSIFFLDAASDGDLSASNVRVEALQTSLPGLRLRFEAMDGELPLVHLELRGQRIATAVNTMPIIACEDGVVLVTISGDAEVFSRWDRSNPTSFIPLTGLTGAPKNHSTGCGIRASRVRVGYGIGRVQWCDCLLKRQLG
jgi:hypothetical protein